jgi:hypothetical protein
MYDSFVEKDGVKKIGISQQDVAFLLCSLMSETKFHTALSKRLIKFVHCDSLK